jgi:AcrR family transcriptional regulator
MSKKEEILLSTLDLASKYGLKSLSMSQIADSVGIKKPSLYNHFNSKEELIKEMYEYIRNKSKQNIANFILDNINEKSAYDILYNSVMNYKKMVLNEDMFKFYSVIYSERTTNNEASKIVIEETDKMINATKKIFEFLKEKNKLFIDDIEMASITFSMTIHSLIDYELDCKKNNQDYNENNIQKYIKWFCNQYSKE